MPVRVVQDNDGAQSGGETSVVPPVGDLPMTDLELVAWKRQAHADDGWSVTTQQAGRRVTAVKGYDASELAKDPNLPAQITRTFRVL
jgi:hypothetical protein